MLLTGPSCALKDTTGMCSASGVFVRADGVHTCSTERVGTLHA